ncbi:MAG: hypothetical protein KDK39_12995 [Leptospiraceae bacterium]|nr:hypothetical protein [Leptospiraceae bacterium]
MRVGRPDSGKLHLCCGLLLSLCLFWAPSVSAQELFQDDILFVEMGGAKGSLYPEQMKPDNGIFYYGVWLGLYQGTLPQFPWLGQVYHRNTASQQYEIQNEGYVRSELAIGDYFSFGALLSADTMVFHKVPADWRTNTSHINSTLVLFNGTNQISQIAADNPYYLAWLYGDVYPTRAELYLNSFSPEIGIHASWDATELYFRAGLAAIISHQQDVSSQQESANLGVRILAYDPVTVHLEAYARGWRISSTRGPSFNDYIHEYGGRFGIGLRLTHP